MKIGILGGAFNPPHKGHLGLARDVKDKLGLERILFISTNISPHKEDNSRGVSHRLNMAKLAAEADESFEAVDIEIKRGGISYTIDTVRQLKIIFPEDDFYLIIGSDLANNFSTWKDYSEIKNLVKIVVAHRKECPLKSKEDFVVVEITQINISSSQIRNLVRDGRSIKSLVDARVANYIREQGLYK